MIAEATTMDSRVRAHLFTFVALIALTLLSVGVTLSGVNIPGGIAFVLCIASLQVLLVCRFLMDVWRDAVAVRWLLAFTVFFAALLFAMTMLSRGDAVEGTEYLGAVSIGVSPDASTPDAEH